MLSYQNTQSNTTRPNFSQTPQIRLRSHTSKVIYKTKNELDRLTELGFQYLQNKNTLRPTSMGIIFKILLGRIEKYPECITRISKLATDDMEMFGDGREIGERQVKRIIKKLADIGFIEYRRSIKYNMHSAYRYTATQLAKDVYYYFYKQNNSYYRYCTLELSTEPVDKVFTPSGCHLETVKMTSNSFQMSPPNSCAKQRAPMIPWVPVSEKSVDVTSNIKNKINKILDNIFAREALDSPSHIFSCVSDKKPDPKPDREASSMAESKEDRRLTPDQNRVVKEILEKSNAMLGDEAVFRDELYTAMDDHHKRGIRVNDFEYFANRVREMTWEKYYWDVRHAARAKH